MRSVYSKILTVILLLGGYTYAQQDPQFSMYMFNRQVLNPAFAGAMGSTNLTTAGRSQWVGIDGHPNTFSLSFNMPVQILKGGIGAYLMSDKIGPFATQTFKVAYSFKLPLGKNGTALHFGLQGGFMQKSLDGTNFRPELLGDPNILNQNMSDMMGDLDAGVYFTLPNDKFYIGLAGDHLLEPKLDKFTTSKDSKVSRAINLTSGYRIDFNEGKTSLTPSVMFKMQGPNNQLDFNVNLNVNPMVFGVSYRMFSKNSKNGYSGDSFDAIMGFKATNNMFVAYSYDYTTSALGTSTSGSHELILSYTFPSVMKFLPPDMGTRDKKTFR